MDRLKILIPTDFSVQAEYAYLMVKNLEQVVPMDIHFLHVLPVPDTVTMNAEGAFDTCGEIDVGYLVKQKEIAERKLADLKALYGNQLHTHFISGKLTDAILIFSEQNKYDLIVMGTRGAWGIKEKISGSETQIIARRSKIPLLSLMCNRSGLVIKNILLVHHFNNPAKENLGMLITLIEAFEARLHLLQITSARVEDEKEAAEANMKNFATMNNLLQYQCHVINDRDVENGVIHFNQVTDMDMVFIGTHGKGGIFHQSATEKLINHLYKPIVSFHLNN
jgi:nucleotide-binding universal stress UspA family protein